MSDNKQIKDGLGNLFTIRSRDVSPLGDGSLQRSMIFATLFPADYGGGGSYHRTCRSDVMAANAAAYIPIYAFRWGSPDYFALVRRIRITVWSGSVGFIPGMATFDMVTARAFTTQLVGGNSIPLGGNVAKLKTSMGSSQASIVFATTAGLTNGVFTPDVSPGSTDSWATTVGGNPYTPLSPMPVKLFEKLQGETPLILAADEGFIIYATVPAQGTWQFVMQCEWDEVPGVSGWDNALLETPAVSGWQEASGTADADQDDEASEEI